MVWVRMRYPQVQGAGIGVAGNHDRSTVSVALECGLGVQPEFRLSLGCVRAVAAKATIREQRTNFTIEVDHRGGLGGRLCNCRVATHRQDDCQCDGRDSWCCHSVNSVRTVVEVVRG